MRGFSQLENVTGDLLKSAYFIGAHQSSKVQRFTDMLMQQSSPKNSTSQLLSLTCYLDRFLGDMSIVRSGESEYNDRAYGKILAAGELINAQMAGIQSLISQ